MTNLESSNHRLEAVADFFVAGGTLTPDHPSYVERPADGELYSLIIQGRFGYVLTSRQMGKSSLMTRTARRLQESGIRTAVIDLQEIRDAESADHWYLALLHDLADELSLSEDVETWWAAHTSWGRVQRFRNFVRDVILAEIEGQLVIFIDEIETTLTLSFSDDFFMAIRAMYNARANNPVFSRLTFVLLGTASPAELIKDPLLTPFNIGEGITLREFTRFEASVLEAGLETVHPRHGAAIFARIYYWTDGHPYLTQRLCKTIAESDGEQWSNERVDGLVEKTFLREEARKETNLKFVQDKVLGHPQHHRLLRLYKRVVGGKLILDDEQSPQQNHLKLAGLVAAKGGYLRTRNRIYSHVFDLAWVRENTPVNWERVALYVAALLLFVILSYSFGVRIHVDKCADQYHQLGSAKEQAASLATIFRLRSVVEDYDHKARELFFDMPRDLQLNLFTDGDVDASDLIVIVKGLYLTLADVDGTNRTEPLLAVMFNALRRLDQTKEATRLGGEISSWLLGRELAMRGDYYGALEEYDRAIDAFNDENPATRYERARVLAHLSEYQRTLSDLDQVLGTARRAPDPTTTPALLKVAPTATVSSVSGATRTSNPDADTSHVQVSPPAGTISLTGTIATGVTVTVTPLPVTSDTPAPVPTLALVLSSFTSDFSTLGQIEKAVRELIHANPGLLDVLASSSGFANLRAFASLTLTPTRPMIQRVKIASIQDGQELVGSLDSVHGTWEGVPEDRDIWLVAWQGTTCWPMDGPAVKQLDGTWQHGPITISQSGQYYLSAALADEEGARLLKQSVDLRSGTACFPEGVQPVDTVNVSVVGLTPPPVSSPRITPIITPITDAYSISGKVLVEAGGGELGGLASAQVNLFLNPDCSASENYDEQFLISVLTSDDGSFKFTNRLPGCYLVQVDLGNTGYSTANGVASILLLRRDRTDVDFYTKTEVGSILGRVWFDENQDGRWDEDEKGELDLTLNLWLDADCDGWPEITSLDSLKEADFEADGSYRFNSLPLDSCYVVELDVPPGAVLTTGEARAHVCMRMACMQDVFAKEVNFGYYRVPPPDPTPTPPAITWYPIDSPTCNPYQKFTYVELAPSKMYLNLYGVAMAPPNYEFWKYEVHYATRDCSTREYCYVHVVTNDDQPASARLAVLPLDGLSSGQEIIIRLRVVAVDGTYDEGCRAWVTIP